MSAIKHAVSKVGGPENAAAICGVSQRSIYKWLAKESLPRTEYTGETCYSEKLAAASGGAFTKEWLLNASAPRRLAA